MEKLNELIFLADMLYQIEILWLLLLLRRGAEKFKSGSMTVPNIG